jgi:hypothetical protein
MTGGYPRPGAMFWLKRNMFDGSYSAFRAASRS